MSLVTLRTPAEVRDHLDSVRRGGNIIGLVPTMGALHAGHASLIERSRAECDVTVVSIFVNPLQFGPNEDYLRYPRPLDRDLAVCEEKGARVVFAPEVHDLYREEQLAFVEVPRLAAHLCGPFRPGHFRGVATVVLKLFNVVQPHRAYFGEKDYQQLCIIRRMVEDFNLPLAIVPVPILRESDGLALSSRNVYLDPVDRAAAPALFRTLESARLQIESGARDAGRVRESAARLLAAESRVRLEYLEIVDPVEVQPVGEIRGPVRIAVAAWIGDTRLIDNVAAAPR